MSRQIGDAIAIGGIPHHHIPWPIEQAFPAGSEKLGAVAGVVRRDHPAGEGGQVGSGSGRRGRGRLSSGQAANAQFQHAQIQRT